ncbi:hypothetical protein HYH03_014666 [Edaphochlamys debaryana]|uniref:RING-type domain-containing protein n=1 Tax=Edaphochlamys debaryana TaxID=47281 RepID=A0A835XTQ9_9CHLO|nr:hypothetical protein HYH03_014666 [Edaphochlamys debaryana]|eukprot:KAG2486740.1 hypothetical protein HYH03_014666 [Edaphochlamys debaryana]
MRRDKGRGGKGAAERQADRHTLLAAAALQDHMARRLRMPVSQPSLQPAIEPGAPMTLAQHLGLIPRPPPLLTEDQWTEVHLKSRLRQDSASECVICREEFQAGAQVLLSCSHTFHRHCLAAFERFARTKTCPLCRCEQYQKRVIKDGEEIYRQRCAVRIQAAWRGYAARRRYRELRRHQPPRDERLRKKWAAERLQEESDRLLSEMDDEVGDLDALFAELDASVAASRQVCDDALRPLAARLQQGLRREAEAEAEAESSRRLGLGLGAGAGAGAGGSGSRAGSAAAGQRGAAGEEGATEARGRPRPPLFESALVAPVRATAVGAGRGAASGAASGSAPGPGRPASAAEVDWDAVVARARARGSLECPICLGGISRRGKEGIAWLSCTHCFHVDCIMAFEAFELASGGIPSCPVCRAHYRRRCFS